MEVKRELVEQAIDALDWCLPETSMPNLCRDAIEALRAALSAPEAEPVAWLNHYAGMPPRIDSAATAGALLSEPLYLHPSAPERKPMTGEEEIRTLWYSLNAESFDDFIDGWRQAEAFHGITKG